MKLEAKKCPFCAKLIPAEATKCYFCFANLEIKREVQMTPALGWLILLVIIGVFVIWPDSKEPKVSKSPSQAKRIKKPQTRKTASRVQQAKWYEGGTLHKATMREWSQASYKNKLATASDLVIGILQLEGVDVTNIDFERKLKPMAMAFANELDATNKDGIVDNQTVAGIATWVWILMKNAN